MANDGGQGARLVYMGKSSVATALRWSIADLSMRGWWGVVDDGGFIHGFVCDVMVLGNVGS